MAGLSRYLALALFNMSLNPVRAAFTPPPGLWLALHVAAPSDSSYGFEASFAGYTRQELASLTSVTAPETPGGNVDIQITNGSPVIFPESTDLQPQTISHWAIWDSANAGDGNILYSGALSAARLIAVGDSVVIPEGNISIVIQ
jgi:hypothetical protein